MRRVASGEPGSRLCPRARRSTIASTRTRINDQIRISPVRLIDPEGEQLGVVSLNRAREAADEVGLDLVEVAPDARPPVVRIMDWGRFQYEQQKRDRAARRRQHTIDIKEVKFRPKTESHDFDVKVRNARRFLLAGKKVKVTVRYRGRELRRPEPGVQILDDVVEALSEVASVESRTDRIEARQLTLMLAPR